MDCPSCGHPNPEGAKFCNECGARLGSLRAAAPEGERRHLTVMFCDLVGSTQLSAEIDAEEFAEIFEAYQRVCREAIESWQGFVAKTFGDGLLVYFGYPQAFEDAPNRALRAGLAAARGAVRGGLVLRSILRS